jgi:hypothetical protein
MPVVLGLRGGKRYGEGGRRMRKRKERGRRVRKEVRERKTSTYGRDTDMEDIGSECDIRRRGDRGGTRT